MGCGASSQPTEANSVTDAKQPDNSAGPKQPSHSKEEPKPSEVRLPPVPRIVSNKRVPRRQSRKRENAAGGPEDPKWSYREVVFGGSLSYVGKPLVEKESGSIKAALSKVRASPQQYSNLFYQTDMLDWPEDQQQFSLVHRAPKTAVFVEAQPAGNFTCVSAVYEALDPSIVNIQQDAYTDSILDHFKGHKLRTPVLPGRGQGCADVPNLRLLDDVDPSDIVQGGVGDCWLLSAISALAEYDGAILKLFKKTPDIDSLPRNDPNMYTVSLFELSDWTVKDILVDERLCSQARRRTLLGALPSSGGELWVTYLEKAVAAHCGGWDKIDGGTCVHAWRLLTGSKLQYTIRRNKVRSFECFGARNTNTGEWEPQKNSPKETFSGLWPNEWPEVGGGGAVQSTLGGTELFRRMCLWEDQDFLMAAGTRDGSDENNVDGIIDGHAYTVLACEEDVAGSEWDLVQVRNPWGKGEIRSGRWDDDGPGWAEFPAVKEKLQPKARNDGIFWLSKEEFFGHFPTLYMCAKSMSEFLQD